MEFMYKLLFFCLWNHKKFSRAGMLLRYLISMLFVHNPELWEQMCFKCIELENIVKQLRVSNWSIYWREEEDASWSSKKCKKCSKKFRPSTPLEGLKFSLLFALLFHMSAFAIACHSNSYLPQWIYLVFLAD